VDSIKTDDNENQARRYFGVDPEAAATELREILGAGGKGEDIITQCRALETWAQNHGRAFGPDFDLSHARPGGLEHYVWNDEGCRVVRKLTYGGCFGRTVRIFTKGLVPATPLEYFDRWGAHNRRFGNITRISGVHSSQPGSLAIVIEQDALPGDLPDLEQVKEFLRISGFREIPQTPYAWIEKDRQEAIFDARPANFVLIDDTPVPFDLIIVPTSKISGLP
jgi:hypothetical protein